MECLKSSENIRKCYKKTEKNRKWEAGNSLVFHMFGRDIKLIKEF